MRTLRCVLTDRAINNLHPGLHIRAVDDRSIGLILEASPAGTKTWYARLSIFGKQKKYKIGSYPNLGLGKARELIAKHRAIAEGGGDPRDLLHRRTLIKVEAAKKSFAEVMDDYIESKPLHKADIIKQQTRWRNAIDQRVLKPSTPIVQVSRGQIVESLGSAAETKWPTFKKVQGDISKALDFLVRHNEKLIKKVPLFMRGDLIKLVHEHHQIKRDHKEQGSLPVPLDHCSGFYKHFESAAYSNLQPNAYGPEALLFLLLTGVRTSGLIGRKPTKAEKEVARIEGFTPKFITPMIWSEVDFDNAIWVIPPERMKMRKTGDKPHLVPLSKQALDLLKRVKKKADRNGHGDPTGFVFHNHQPTKNGWYSNGLFNAQLIDGPHYDYDLLDVNGEAHTVERHPNAHGFRKTLSNFALRAQFREITISAQLAHEPKHAKVDASFLNYIDEELLGERRDLLQKWADFLSKGKLPKGWIADDQSDNYKKKAKAMPKIDTATDPRFQF